MTAITRYAEHRPGFEDRLALTTARLRQIAAEFGDGVLLASSLGAEDMVLTDLIARHHLRIAIATLDTGALPPQTLALLPRIHARYGIHVQVHRPQAQAVIQFVREHGPLAMRDSVALRQACCGLRKLVPLAQMLAGKRAWVTGLRREQSATRAELVFRDSDAQQRVKFNPLADWSQADVWHFIGLHQVPYNPLHDAFYASIGCAPCSRPVALGEDERAGRWWWEQTSAKECGLHAPTPSALNP